MDIAPAATLLAAVIGGGFLLWQQSRQWNAARRDKLRDAYSDWLGKLMVLRRKDERVMEAIGYLYAELERQRSEGLPVGPGGSIPVPVELYRESQVARHQQHVAQYEEDVAFSRIALLDGDNRRVLRVEEVRRMVPFVEVKDDEPPSLKEFDAKAGAQALALGQLTLDVNRTLELESVPGFWWDSFERGRECKEESLHARLRVDRRGRRPRA